MRSKRRRELEAAARPARAQGLFNVAGGAWPLVWLRSFEWIFVPKRDIPPTYLFDALMEAGWIYAWTRR